MVPAPYWREKTGPTGHLRGLQPSSHHTGGQFSVLVPKLGPFPQCQTVFSLEGKGGEVEGTSSKTDAPSPLLQNSCPPTAELLGSPGRLFWEPMKIHDIRWNFEKFLVGPDGIPIMRWYHRTTVSNVKMDILSYMRRQAALGARGK